FSYDHTGARVTKRASDEVAFYINPYAEMRNGRLINYIFAGSQRIVEIDGQGQPFFNHSDHLGSSNIVTDRNGRITGRTEYYAFGQERRQEGSVHLPYSYTDKERDASTGLHCFGARYYFSAIGRFLSPDPVGIKADRLLDPQRLNPYAYVRNNPLKYVDPNGEDLTIVYSFGPDISAEQTKWFKANQDKIFATIQEKFNAAGVKNVVFKSADSLLK